MALKGVKVLEIMGLAPGPLCGTILADFGASVTVIQKVKMNTQILTYIWHVYNVKNTNDQLYAIKLFVL